MKFYTIGEKHAAKGGYDTMIGAKVTLVMKHNNTVIVKLRSHDDPRVKAYAGDTFTIHADDLIPMEVGSAAPEQMKASEPVPVTIEIKPQKPELKVGKFIKIGSEYADRLGYKEAVGQEAVIQEVLSAICQVMTLGGQLLDIHHDDVCGPDVVEPPKMCYVAMNHDTKIIYYGYTKEDEQLLSWYKKHTEGHIVTGHVHDLSDFIGKKGYVARHIEEVQEKA